MKRVLKIVSVSFMALAVGVAGVSLSGLGGVTPAMAQFSPTFEFLKALKKNDYRGVKSNLMKGANVNTRDDDGVPAIVLATDMGQPSLVKFLLEQGAHVDNAVQRTGETALMKAAAQGDKISSGVLLFFKADINAQDRRGETPLIKAARAGNREVVKLLIDTGADLELQDYTGKSALDYARLSRKRPVEKMLAEAEAGAE